MASLNSSTHVHAGSEGSFSRRTTRRSCTPGAVSCGRRREGSSRRLRPPSPCCLAGGTAEAARTTGCSSFVRGVVRPSSRGQFAAAVRSPLACRRQLARLDAVVSCAKIGRSAASARIRTIRLRQSRAKVWQVIGGPMIPRSPEERMELAEGRLIRPADNERRNERWTTPRC